MTYESIRAQGLIVKTDRGDEKVIRVYEIKGGQQVVVFFKQDFGNDVLDEHLPHQLPDADLNNVEVLELVFSNNKEAFRLRSVCNFDAPEVLDWIYAVNLQSLLADTKGLSSISLVAEIAPRDFLGCAETSLGKMGIWSL